MVKHSLQNKEFHLTNALFNVLRRLAIDTINIINVVPMSLILILNSYQHLLYC